MGNADVLGARNDPHGVTNPAPITNVHDYNRDGKVDATDQLIAQQNQTSPTTAVRVIGGATFSQLLVLAQNYGGPGRRAAGDYNGDGQVNFTDLLILAQNYGPAPAPTSAAVGANLAGITPDALLTSAPPAKEASPRSPLPPSPRPNDSGVAAAAGGARLAFAPSSGPTAVQSRLIQTRE